MPLPAHAVNDVGTAGTFAVAAWQLEEPESVNPFGRAGDTPGASCVDGSGTNCHL